MPEVAWAEWRVGIERDQCMSLIQAERTLETLPDSRGVLKDASRIVEEMNSGPLDSLPRHREGCTRCAYQNVCHP
jgi:CRISPR/Cas system-associated exonuclease Cas4 (RecB family)